MRRFISALILLLVLAAIPAMTGSLRTGGGGGSATDVACTDCVALTTETTGNYALGDAEGGAATTGDSATAFFSAGTIEVARLPAVVQRFSLPFSTGALAPADSTNYFLHTTGGTAHTGEAQVDFTYVPAGTVIKACVYTQVSTILGTTEDVTFTVRKNSVDTTMVILQDWDLLGPTTTCTTVNPFTVVAEDIISIKAATPAWVTNPTGVRNAAAFDLQQ